MYSIENMSIKDYLLDRTYRYFKPLNSILCCFKIKEPNIKKVTCDCPLDIFTDSIISTLQNRQVDLNKKEPIYEYIQTSRVHTVDIFSSSNLILIRNRYA